MGMISHIKTMIPGLGRTGFGRDFLGFFGFMVDQKPANPRTFPEYSYNIQ
jgi:hypothetical protein